MRVNNGVILAFIITIACFFHYETFSDYPIHVHAWAQSDRFALALGFLNNGFDFLKPETFLLNLQFPGSFEVPKENSITAVNFPINEYIVAFAMKILGTEKPFVFRFYSLFWSIAALLYLSKIAELFKLNSWLRILLVAFAASSPVFAYYQNGFLPSVPAVGLCIISLYHYFRYIKSAKNWQFNLSLFFLAISALSRTTFLIPLIAVLCYETLRVLGGYALLKPKVLPLLVLSAILIINFQFQSTQINRFGSLFLYTLLPANSLEELKLVLHKTAKANLTNYFTLAHYSLIVALIAAKLYFKKLKVSKFFLISNEIIWLPIITSFGCILFFLAMATQFPEHDYYFLDTFFIPALLLLVYLLKEAQTIFKKYQLNEVPQLLIVLTFCSFSAVQAKENLGERRTEAHWNVSYTTAENFENSAQILKELAIDEQAKFLSLGSYVPNLPFIFLNRKGYHLQTGNKSLLNKGLGWDFDYVVFENKLFLQEYYSKFPAIINELELIYSNERISIGKLDNQKREKSLIEFFSLNDSKKIKSEHLTFENAVHDGWLHVNRTDSIAFSGSFCGHVRADKLYSISFNDNLESKRVASSFLTLSCVIMSRKSQISAKIVSSLTHNNELLNYEEFDLNTLPSTSNDWKKTTAFFSFPALTTDSLELKVYFWNPNKDDFFVDNVELNIYSP